MGAAQAPKIVLSLETGHGEQAAVHGGNGIKDRHSVLLDVFQNVFRRRAAAEDGPPVADERGTRAEPALPRRRENFSREIKPLRICSISRPRAARCVMYGVVVHILSR